MGEAHEEFGLQGSRVALLRLAEPRGVKTMHIESLELGVISFLTLVSLFTEGDAV